MNVSSNLSVMRNAIPGPSAFEGVAAHEFAPLKEIALADPDATLGQPA
jgi:hypothetical protein